MIPALLRSWLSQFLYTPNTIRYRVEWRPLQEALRMVGPVQSLFDGGAGSGEFVRKALAAGFCKHGTAMELDPENLRHLRAKLGGRSDVTIVSGSIEDIPFADGVFDLVMSTQVLEHIAEHERAAAELARVLKPGGHMIISVPHPPEPFPNEGHVREGYTESDLRALFEPLGMKLLDVNWCLTRGTVRRMMRVDAMPLGGLCVPVAWVDAEKKLSRERRQADQPFGIMGLFQKRV